MRQRAKAARPACRATPPARLSAATMLSAIFSRPAPRDAVTVSGGMKKKVAGADSAGERLPLLPCPTPPRTRRRLQSGCTRARLRDATRPPNPAARAPHRPAMSSAMGHRAAPMPLPAAAGVLGSSVAAILWLLCSAGRSGSSRPGRHHALLFAVASTFVVGTDASDIIVSGSSRCRWDRRPSLAAPARRRLSRRAVAPARLATPARAAPRAHPPGPSQASPEPDGLSVAEWVEP